ncbi:unnamed protein product [Calypogeia fissa]
MRVWIRASVIRLAARALWRVGYCAWAGLGWAGLAWVGLVSRVALGWVGLRLETAAHGAAKRSVCLGPSRSEKSGRIRVGGPSGSEKTACLDWTLFRAMDGEKGGEGLGLGDLCARAFRRGAAQSYSKHAVICPLTNVVVVRRVVAGVFFRSWWWSGCYCWSHSVYFLVFFSVRGADDYRGRVAQGRRRLVPAL